MPSQLMAGLDTDVNLKSIMCILLERSYRSKLFHFRFFRLQKCVTLTVFRRHRLQFPVAREMLATSGRLKGVAVPEPEVIGRLYVSS